MPDEVSKTMMLASGAIVLMAVLALTARPADPKQHRRAHVSLVLGGAALGIGIVVASAQETSTFGHTSVVLVAVGVASTTALGLVHLMYGSRVIGVAAMACATLTATAAIVMVGTRDSDDCCAVPTTAGVSVRHLVDFPLH